MFKPGQSGNPSGRPKLPKDAKELARMHTPAAIDELAKIGKNRKAPTTARVQALQTLSYVGYGKPISRLRVHAANAIEKIDLLMKRQGHLLEAVAIDELIARRSRLENFGDKARFALADSYDRATQAQARREAPP